MAFSATIDQMWAGTKTVTRRDAGSWKRLEPGDRILAIEKGMGLKAGEKQVVIGEIEIVSNTIVELVEISPADIAAEGFPDLDRREFLDQVWRPLHGLAKFGQKVRRIEFVHVDPTEPTEQGGGR